MKFITFSLTALASMAAVSAAPPAEKDVSAAKACPARLGFYVSTDDDNTRHHVGGDFGKNFDPDIFEGPVVVFVRKNDHFIDSNGSDEPKGDEKRRAMRISKEGYVGLGTEGNLLRAEFSKNAVANHKFSLHDQGGKLRLRVNYNSCSLPNCKPAKLVRRPVTK